MAAPSAAVSAVLDEARQLNRSKDRNDLSTAVDRLASWLAADYYTYHIVRAAGCSEPGPWYVTNYPAAWVSEYLAEGHTDNDPVLRQASRGLAPFQWRQLTVHDPAEHRVMEGARRHGLFDGFAVPLNGDREFAAMTFAFDLSAREMQDWMAERGSLACMAAMYIHDAARRVFFQGEAAAAPLTARERECIRWTAAGKTSWEIGGILGISEKTANIHVTNAMAKLDVRTRPQLVARAYWLGVLNSM